jgi:hypothetical protein
MKQRLLASALFGMVGAATPHAQRVPAMDPGVLAAQQKFHHAVKTCNMADLNAVVDDDLVYIHGNGHIDDKKSLFAVVNKCVFSEFRLDVKTSRMHGDAAILVGNLPFAMKSGGLSMTLFVSQTYVKRNGTWRLVSHQGADTVSFGAVKK